MKKINFVVVSIVLCGFILLLKAKDIEDLKKTAERLKAEIKELQADPAASAEQRLEREAKRERLQRIEMRLQRLSK